MVKAYTDVKNHKIIRAKQMSGEEIDLSEEKAGKAMQAWGAVPESVIGADPVDHRMNTLLTMLQDAEADPEFPEFDRQQVIDEMKQYLNQWTSSLRPS